MERLTEKRDGQNVIPLRQNGKIKWAICSAGLGDAPTEYLYGDHADRLAAYEDTGLEPEEIELLAKQRDLYVDACGELPLKRIRELAQADREGRIVLRSAGAGKQCGSCGHWHRIRDTRRGTCDVRQWLRDRYGASDPGTSFTPAQSYGACRDYIPVEGRGNG